MHKALYTYLIESFILIRFKRRKEADSARLNNLSWVTAVESGRNEIHTGYLTIEPLLSKCIPYDFPTVRDDS